MKKYCPGFHPNPNLQLHRTQASSKPDLAFVYDFHTDSFNFFKLYLAYFNHIPNKIEINSIDCEKAIEGLYKNYRNEIRETGYNKSIHLQRSRSTIDYGYFFLYEDLLVAFKELEHQINIYYRNTPEEKIETLINELTAFKRKKIKKSEVKILIETGSGLQLDSLKITPAKMQIEENYNDDFLQVHQTIFERLSRQNNKGIVLLHGIPGTGKTSYLRYLIPRLKKTVIYMPPEIAAMITHPSMIPLLASYPDSVIIIEDAEGLITDRRQHEASPVTSLLNLADGLLSDSMNIQLICTFNTKISEIDSALMRKGRLIARYEFKELETGKAQKLSDQLGFQTIIGKPMTLAAIYNQHQQDYTHEIKRHAIGFHIKKESGISKVPF